MKNYISIVLFVLLAVGTPLVANMELLLHPQILTLALAIAVVFVTQPPLDIDESKDNARTDRNTFWIIGVFSLLSIMAPIVEWVYWNDTKTSQDAIVTGLVILISGIALRIWAIRVLGEFFTNTVQAKSNHKLIKTGPYKIVRHPSYLGAYLAFIGVGIFLGAFISTGIAMVLMFFAYYNRINVEELTLVEIFGDQYDEFRKTKSGLIPFIW